MKLCVHEAMANVIRHAYHGGTGPVDVSLDDLGNALAVVVSDHGVGAPAKARSAGMGFRLMTQLSTGCTLHISSDGMTVEMVFPLPSATGPSEPPRIDRDRRLLHF